MRSLRSIAYRARPLAFVVCLALVGCSALMTKVGGGMTPELRRNGVAARAQVLEIWDTGWTINDDPVIGMRVRVQPSDRPPFEARIEKTTVSRIAVAQFQPGAVIPVRFDPKDPTAIAVDPDGAVAEQDDDDESGETAASATGNPYRDHFEQAQVVGASVLPPPPSPELYLGTADEAADTQTLFENHYTLIGSASVHRASDPQQALDQGKEIGAALVVVYGHFAPPAGMTLPVLPFARSSATPSAAAGAARFFTGSLGPDDQFASYWARTRPPVLGMVSRPLDAREQERLHRHDAIVVESVMNGSPAAAAGIVAGDVVVAIDGRSLPDPRAVPGMVNALAGKKVAIELLRNGSPLSMTVQLNPTSP